MQNIIIATGNTGKMREFREILAGPDLVLTSLVDHFSPIPSIPETGQTFLENALLKARWVFERKQTWVMADDSGLEVDALGGRPGVRSARFAGEQATSADNNRLLLHELGAAPGKDRTARFKCVIVLVTGAQSYFAAEGCCEGTIGFSPRGEGGFGYDPLFVPQGMSRTFAELGSEEKHAISHRGKALQTIRKKLHEL